MALYSGGSYQMTDNYSTMMVMVFMAFLYGYGLPLLFPLCLLYLLIFTLQEKFTLAYFYSQPPAYKGKLG